MLRYTGQKICTEFCPPDQKKTCNRDVKYPVSIKRCNSANKQFYTRRCTWRKHYYERCDDTIKSYIYSLCQGLDYLCTNNLHTFTSAGIKAKNLVWN